MVANDTAIDILRSSGLNVTEIRCRVVVLLLQPGKALTQKELEEALESQMNQVDRVTLYRTIKVLLEKKVIHQITIDSQIVKYKLAGEHRRSDHPHFHCCCCDRLLCMPQIKIEQDMLPGGFIMQTSNLIIEGVCPDCNKKGKVKPTQ